MKFEFLWYPKKKTLQEEVEIRYIEHKSIWAKNERKYT